MMNLDEKVGRNLHGVCSSCNPLQKWEQLSTEEQLDFINDAAQFIQTFRELVEGVESPRPILDILSWKDYSPEMAC